MYFFYLGGYKIQMLRWLNTDMSSQDKRLLLLQFKDCETGMMLQQRGDFSCSHGRLGLIKVQDGHCTKLRPSMRWGNCCERGVSSWEGGHHMFWTVCQVGDRTSPVSGYMSKNKNYSSRLKRRRCSHPSQIVCEYKPQKVYPLKAGAEPEAVGETHTGRLSLRRHTHGWGFSFFSLG